MTAQADLSSHPLLANRQVILSSKDGHAFWVSTATLELNGPYPEAIEGGVIVRDEATGEPTGAYCLLVREPNGSQRLLWISRRVHRHRPIAYHTSCYNA